MYLPHLSTTTLNLCGRTSRVQCPLTTALLGERFSSIKGTTCRNTGMRAWNGFRFEHHIRLYVENNNIHRAKWKMLRNNRDPDLSKEFCCHNALGLVRTVRPIFRSNSLGIGLHVSHWPSCIATTTSSRNDIYPFRKICWMYCKTKWS